NWPELSAAAKVGWVKLQGYYCKATGHVYAVATAIDPRLKYEWWEAENWNEYRSEAIELVNMTWDKYKLALVPVHQAYDFDALIQRRPGRADQLAQYINAYTLDDPTSSHSNTIVLDYWHASSEQVLSRAKHFLSPERNRLSSEKLRTRVLVDSWSRFFGENEKISDGSRTMRLS
ncbi:hypothetical protein INT45_013874, partial [Circinella minor]